MHKRLPHLEVLHFGARAGCVALLLSLLPPPLLAASSLVATLKGDQFQETVSAEVVVSGTVVVGVDDALPRDGGSIDELAISLADPLPQEICLQVASRDGVYSARNAYTVPAGAGVGQSLRFPYDRSAHRELLSRYADTDLSFMATAGACTQQTAQAYVVHLVGAPAPRSIRLFVNAGGATDVYLHAPGGAFVDCNPIIEGRHTNFDFHCETSWPLDRSGKLELTLERERYGRPFPAVKLNVAYPVS